MKFGTTEQVFQCFKRYAKQMGFAPRRRSSKRDENRNLRYVAFAYGRCRKPDLKLDSIRNPLTPQPAKKGLEGKTGF